MAETAGETPVAVVMSPKTVHGWRPTSVKIQPKEFAAIGKSGAATIIQCHQRARITAAGPPSRSIALRRVAHSAAIAVAIEASPAPIMSRNVQ